MLGRPAGSGHSTRAKLATCGTIEERGIFYRCLLFVNPGRRGVGALVLGGRGGEFFVVATCVVGGASCRGCGTAPRAVAGARARALCPPRPQGTVATVVWSSGERPKSRRDAADAAIAPRGRSRSGSHSVISQWIEIRTMLALRCARARRPRRPSLPALRPRGSARCRARRAAHRCPPAARAAPRAPSRCAPARARSSRCRRCPTTTAPSSPSSAARSWRSTTASTTTPT